MMISIDPIPAFTDNYIWCLHDGKFAWVVDPGAAAPVIRFLAAQQLTLQGILVTHHHADHIGGIDELLQRFSDLTIYGPYNPTIAPITRRLREGETITVFGEVFNVLEVPGHTLDHIAYLGTTMHSPALFCGDTLFAAGCGRLFEGTPEQMFASLEKIKHLADDTRVYCAHEYTQANLRFAQAVEPDNLAVKQRAQSAAQLRANHQPTVPSTLALELETNPFLRADQSSVRMAALRHDPQSSNEVEIFAAIRRWKDRF